MNRRDIFRKFIDEFSPVFRICPDDPEDKFVLFHIVDILVHPRRHAAEHIRIAPLQDKTDLQ